MLSLFQKTNFFKTQADRLRIMYLKFWKYFWWNWENSLEDSLKVSLNSNKEVCPSGNNVSDHSKKIHATSKYKYFERIAYHSRPCPMIVCTSLRIVFTVCGDVVAPLCVMWRWWYRDNNECETRGKMIVRGRANRGEKTPTRKTSPSNIHVKVTFKVKWRIHIEGHYPRFGCHTLPISASSQPITPPTYMYVRRYSSQFEHE